jgi:hypothetical protein
VRLLKHRVSNVKSVRTQLMLLVCSGLLACLMLTIVSEMGEARSVGPGLVAA